MPTPAPPAAPAFHEGERALQTSQGIEDRMATAGAQLIRDYMPQTHRDFFTLLPFLVVGSLDAAARPSASILAAPPGFVTSPDEHTLRVAAMPQASDPLAANLAPDAPLGLLGIQPHTRRRNRANGVVSGQDKSGFSLAVRQSFGNCPKYIQAREPVYQADQRPGAVRSSVGLDAAARTLIAQADTFYIATAHPDAATSAMRPHGVDVSHRGGRPGFVHQDDGNTLTVPDYRGNFFFNTLGNLLRHPYAGLVFVDFETGDLLHLDARAEIITQANEVARFDGAERLLRLTIDQTRWRSSALALRWGPATLSPSLDELAPGMAIQRGDKE